MLGIPLCRLRLMLVSRPTTELFDWPPEYCRCPRSSASLSATELLSALSNLSPLSWANRSAPRNRRELGVVGVAKRDDPGLAEGRFEVIKRRRGKAELADVGSCI